MFNREISIESLIKKGRTAVKVFEDTKVELTSINERLVTEIDKRKQEIEQLDTALNTNTKVVNKINEFLGE